MNWLDIVLLLLVAAALALCIVTLVRSSKKGRGCCGTCSCCRGNCPSKQQSQEPLNIPKHSPEASKSTEIIEEKTHTKK